MEIEPPPSAARDWGSRLSLKLYRYRGLVKRRWWVLASAIALGLGIEALLVFSKPVEYTSDGQLSLTDKIEVQGAAQVQPNQDMEFFGTARQWLQNQEIKSRAERRVKLEAPNLRGKVELTATRLPGTSIFDLVGNGDNPEYTQRFVDAAMEEFLNSRHEKEQGQAELAAKQINEEIAKQRDEKAAVEKELRDYSDQNDMAGWTERQKEASTFLGDLSKKRAKLETELDRLQNLTSEQLLMSPSNSAATADTPGTEKTPETGETPIGLDLSTQYLQRSLELSRARALLAERSKVWKPKHPKLIAIQDQIDLIKGEIEDIKKQNEEQSKAQIGQIKAELVTLNDNIKNWEIKAKDAGHKTDGYTQRVDAVAARPDRLSATAGGPQKRAPSQGHGLRWRHSDHAEGQRSRASPARHSRPSSYRPGARPHCRLRHPPAHGSRRRPH